MLTEETVHTIAHLARLSLKPEEISRYARELSSTMDFVEQLEKIDTQHVEVMAHPLDCTQRLRADVVTEVNQRETFQSIAPATAVGLYLVPRVIE